MITNQLLTVALQAAYPPGSPFKLLTALAGYANGSHERENKIPLVEKVFIIEWVSVPKVTVELIPIESFNPRFLVTIIFLMLFITS